MTNAFSDFAEAVSRSSVSGNKLQMPDYQRVAVLGGGEDARMIAALCLSENVQVTMFSAYGAELQSLRSSSGVTLRGAALWAPIRWIVKKGPLSKPLPNWMKLLKVLRLSF